jgi:hemoglobin-like flavoprotein
MSERDVEVFNDSLERCTRHPRFLDRFYELFLASSEAVARKFTHTDFKKQKRALRTSLYMMMLVTEGKAEGDVHLERIARRHSRSELDVKPELYELWLDCLIQAVKEFDPSFNRETEGAWRSIMRPGIEFMRSRY